MFRIRKAYSESVDIITKTYKSTIKILEEQVTLAGETNTILKNENKTLRDSNELLQQTVDLLKEVERTPEANTEVCSGCVQYEEEIAQLKTEIMEQGKTIERLEGEKAKLQDVVEKLNEESKKSPAHISSEQLAELKRLKRNEYQRKWLAKRKKNATENIHQL